MTKWFDKYLSVYGMPFKDVPQQTKTVIRENILRKKTTAPVVSLVVIAHNEECRLAACLWSLSEMETKYPVEILGVNNSSADGTGEVFKALGVDCFDEPRKSPGFARRCGLEKARGKYHFFIDADTMYPKCYVDKMMGKLERSGNVCVGTFWSFYPDTRHSAMGLHLFELVRDAFLWLQHFKRPELCVRGMTMAFRTDCARQVGLRTDIRRGEDGSLALGLKRFGRIVFLYSRKARPVTGYGTLGERPMASILAERVRVQSKRLAGLFHKQSHYEDTADNIIK